MLGNVLPAERCLRYVLLALVIGFMAPTAALADEKSQESKLISHGIAYVKAGQYENGILIFKLAIRNNPKSFDAYNNLGLAYHAAGKFDEAIKAYRRAIEIRTDSSVAYNNLGMSYRSLGKLDTAIESYQTAIRLDANNVVAYMNLGTAYDLSGNFDKAIETYRKALEIKPEFAEAHYNLGVTYQNSGKLEKALEAYQKTIGLQPDHKMAHYNLGRIHLLQFDRNAALNEYESLKKLDPNLALKLTNVPIFFGDGANLYYDLLTVQKVEGDVYNVWTYVEFTKKLFVSEGKTSEAIYFLKEIDCNKYVSRDTKTYVLHVDDTKSKIEDAEKRSWKPVAAGSPFEAVVKVVCAQR